MKIDYRKLKPYRDYQRARMLGNRLLVLRILFIAGFLLYGSIFWYLQIVKGPEYSLLAEENRLHRRIEQPVRGIIRDWMGEILVTNRPAFSVFIDRERAADPREQVSRLASFLDEDEASLDEQYEKRRKQPRFVPLRLMPDVTLATASRIEAHRHELPAIDVDVEAKRYYPFGAAAAHAIGYIAEASEAEIHSRHELLPGDQVGRVGVEMSFDSQLRGAHGRVLEEVNARGRPLRVVRRDQPARDGQTLRVTLDARMQKVLHEAFDGRAGAAVFLDPRTGALRALYSGPSYDPNLFAGRLSPDTWKALSEDPLRPLQNRALAGTYSPGSTFKVIMAVAALQEGFLKPGEKIFCGGTAIFYGQKKHCHRRWGHGKIELAEALERSCNIFFYTLGQRMGIETIEKWSRRFGLGSTTGIGLGSELAGLVPSNEWKMRTHGEPWYPGETISVAIGQGPLHITPIQMAVEAAVIANGGYRVHPYILDRQGGIRPPEDLGIRPEVLAPIAEAMVSVVHGAGGTARRARIPGYTLAGKTGTAQVVSLDAAENPGDHALFIGFGPVESPELAWAVVVEHGGHGGASAAPIVAKVVKSYLERRHDLPSDQIVQIANGADHVALQ